MNGRLFTATASYVLCARIYELYPGVLNIIASREAACVTANW